MAITEVGYGAASVTLSDKAKAQLAKFQKLGFGNLAVCMAKTPMSISTDGNVKGAPTQFDVLSVSLSYAQVLALSTRYVAL